MIRKSKLFNISVGDIYNNQKVIKLFVSNTEEKLTYKNYLCELECLKCGTNKYFIRSRLATVGCTSELCSRKVDIKVGDCYGKLTILEIFRYHNHTYYRCKCDCGGEETYGKNPAKRSPMCNKCLIIDVAARNLLPNKGAAINRLFGKYKKRIKAVNKDFSLSLEDFKVLINRNCNYCDSVPKEDHEGIVRNGIDRLNSDIGYVFENCVTCCTICNRAKSNLSHHEFKRWINDLMIHQLKET